MDDSFLALQNTIVSQNTTVVCKKKEKEFSNSFKRSTFAHVKRQSTSKSCKRIERVLYSSIDTSGIHAESLTSTGILHDEVKGLIRLNHLKQLHCSHKTQSD